MSHPSLFMPSDEIVDEGEGLSLVVGVIVPAAPLNPETLPARHDPTHPATSSGGLLDLYDECEDADEHTKPSGKVGHTVS
ncbi:MAG: hypothetical protein KIT02_03145 [Devosia sp.]|uniref:hypothetical protein n=1 Tax=Devosia sp. TaxID=1871048 RepID=UPI0024C84CB4|nr:hypothetical protein [Devosia sp.]UYO00237.1 MAG: hypothetical protein KIT02_03145 [Devosia sp.]